MLRSPGRNKLPPNSTWPARDHPRSVAGGHHAPYLKQILAIVALLLGMWISFYWHSVQYITELEEVDSALLTDDIPPEAFMDNDFFEWLKDDSSEE